MEILAQGNRIRLAVNGKAVLDWRDPLLAIPLVGARVTRATMLISGAAVNFEQTSDGVRLTLPKDNGVGEPDRVIVLRTARSRQ